MVGLLLITAGLGGIGYVKATSLSGRCRELAELRRALTILHASVAHSRRPAGETLKDAAASLAGVVADSCALATAYLSGGPGLSAGEAWARGFRAVEHRSCLTAADRSIFEEFCAQFGRLDATTELGRIEDTVARLDAQAEGARQEREGMERLYRLSGFLTGLALSVMLW